jgi:AraC-like DNA-binding protein/quercetin dioxygenase-like cupin family protein
MATKSQRYLDYEVSDRALAAMPKEYPSNCLIPLHFHGRAQIVFAVAGVMEITAGRQSWVIPPQRALWVPAGVAHSMRAHGAVSLRTLYVRHDAEPRGAPQSCRAIQVSPLLRELLVRAADMRMDYDERGHEGRIMQLILDELQWHSQPPLLLTMPISARLVAICEALRRDAADPRTLNEWARELGCTTRTIARDFQAETGASFLSWRHQARLLAALRLLHEGESVLSAGQVVGYETASAFTAMFKRLMGCTPSQYLADMRMSETA